MKLPNDPRAITIKTSGNTQAISDNDVFVGDGSWTITESPILAPYSQPPRSITPLHTQETWKAIHAGKFIFIWSKATKQWCYWGYDPKERKRVFNQWGITAFFDADEILLFLKEKPDDIIVKKIFEIKRYLPAKVISIKLMANGNSHAVGSSLDFKASKKERIDL